MKYASGSRKNFVGEISKKLHHNGGKTVQRGGAFQKKSNCMKTLLAQILTLTLFSLFFAACGKDDDPTPVGTNPDTAAVQSVDRFSAAAATLMVRDASNGLPAANVAINFDQGPFITQGLGPAGQVVEYYNFDVMPTATAPIFVPMYNGKAIPGQLNIIDKVPGEAGYNDFWQVNIVEVPEKFVANTITSFADINAKGYKVTPTTNIVNCPVVPAGSTASKRVGGGASGIVRGWYKGKVVNYFEFGEAAISGTSVPTSPIYVTFNINPDQPGGGPPSGFITEAGTSLTHNVLATLPGDAGYSPLWSVSVYDNADFGSVSNLATVQSSNILAAGVMTVNCPMASK